MNQFNFSLIRISLVMLFLLLLSQFLLKGCANDGVDGRDGRDASIPLHYNNYSPELHSMIERYELHLGRDVSAVKSIKLVPKIQAYDETGNIIDSVIGVCYRGKNRRILIESDYYWKANRVSVEALVYHELAHCVQMKDHSSEYLSPTCPSIMNPYMPSPKELFNCWDVMVEDLFDRSSNLHTNSSPDCYDQPDKTKSCIVKGDL